MRRDIHIQADGARLAGWLYLPDESGAPFPLIVMSHGFSAVKDMGLDGFARVFVEAGCACLVYDHRNFGDSEGEPRHEADPWQQVHDMRDVISFARRLPDIDPGRIGVWGTSYSGGHALVIGAIDRRVRCVVAQVPLVGGYETMKLWVSAAKLPAFMDRLVADREARAKGEKPAVIPAALKGSETEEWARAVDKDGRYANEVTLRSMELIMEYDPAAFIHRIGPTPLLMIVAARDSQTPTDGQLAAFNRAVEPKKLVILDCRHYDPYTGFLPQASAAARDWFVQHLKSA